MNKDNIKENDMISKTKFLMFIGNINNHRLYTKYNDERFDLELSAKIEIARINLPLNEDERKELEKVITYYENEFTENWSYEWPPNTEDFRLKKYEEYVKLHIV